MTGADRGAVFSHPLNATAETGIRWATPDTAPVVRPGDAAGFAGATESGPFSVVAPPVIATGPTGARWPGDPVPGPDDAPPPAA